jgi:flavin-dependent dehydrogenase
VGDALGMATLDMGEGIGAAIRSGQLAAEAIISAGEYSVANIPSYSFPSLVGFRK